MRTIGVSRVFGCLLVLAVCLASALQSVCCLLPNTSKQLQADCKADAKHATNTRLLLRGRMDHQKFLCNSMQSKEMRGGSDIQRKAAAPQINSDIRKAIRSSADAQQVAWHTRLQQPLVRQATRCASVLDRNTRVFRSTKTSCRNFNDLTAGTRLIFCIRRGDGASNKSFDSVCCSRPPCSNQSTS